MALTKDKKTKKKGSSKPKKTSSKSKKGTSSSGTDQTLEQKKMINNYFCGGLGAFVAYLLGYMMTLASREKVGLGEGAYQMVMRFMKYKFFYLPSFPALGIWIIIGLFAFLASRFMNWREADNHVYDQSKVKGDGGMEDDLEEYGKKYIADEDDIDDVLRKSVENLPEKYRYINPNMIIGQEYWRSMDAYKTRLNMNVMVIGGAGTGKSRFFIKPNLLQMNSSYVITDPSGELLTSVGGVLKNHGYKIKVFNIENMDHSDCYNPLHYIRNEAGVTMLIDCFIKNTSDPSKKGGDEFFTNAERLLYSACIFWILDYCDDIRYKTFAHVLDMVNSSEVIEGDDTHQSDLDRMFELCEDGSLAQKYYRAFKQAAGKTLKSIIISCVTRLQPFMTPQVRALTAVDTLELDMVGEEKTALFIITPQADRTYAFLASMLYTQLFETLYFKGNQNEAKNGNPKSPFHVRCMMDEFANIGEIPEFPEKLSTMRKYNISSSIILQDKSQIEAMYQDKWKTLIANCDSLLFLGSSELDTLKYLSEKLGNMTVKQRSRSSSQGGKGNSSFTYSYDSREVKTAEELGRLDNTKCVIFTRGLRPYEDEKYHYEEHPLYPETADGDGEAFKYTEYYNTKEIAEGELDVLMAMTEINLQKSKSLRHENDTSDPIEDDINDFLNANQPDGIEGSNQVNILVDEFLQSVMQSDIGSEINSGEICIKEMEAISPNRLYDIVSLSRAFYSTKPLLLFADNKSPEKYFCGICDKTEFLTFYHALNNSYALTCEVRGDTVYGKISSDHYVDFLFEAEKLFKEKI